MSEHKNTSVSISNLLRNPLPAESEEKNAEKAEAILAKFKRLLYPAPIKLKSAEADWECKLEQWDTIGKESAALMLNLAEQRLSETVSSSDSMSKKTEVLISILVPFLTILIGYVLSKDLETIMQEVLSLSGLICTLPLCASLYLLKRNFAPYQITVPGESPSNIAIARNFDNGLSEEEKYYNLVLNQLGSYQKRIKINERINSRRVKNIDKALFFLMLIPFVPVLAFLLIFLSSLLNL